MIGRLNTIRAEEWRETLGATLTLFVVLIAHALLETARDALFLSNIPASRLPWMYLVLALVGVVVAESVARGSRRLDPRRLLSLTQLVAAGGTACLAPFASSGVDAVFYVLYVWTGVASISIVVRFWQHLGDRFTVTQAKRLFPIIGTGSVAGVLAGYALADALARRAGPAPLVPASAAFFLLSAAGPLLFLHPSAGAASADGRNHAENRPSLRDGAAAALVHPYLRRVATILLLASAAATLSDFIFKSIVARQIPAEDLGPFFARTYLAFNVLSLTVLVGAVTPAVHRLGVTGTLAVLPAALFAGGLGVAASGALAAALLLKGADGSLRWSAHKTAIELLYVPMSSELRNMAKSVIDVVTQRAGQALGSLLILAALLVTDSERFLGPLVAALAAAWLYVSLNAREGYLDLFRAALSRGAVQTRLDFPDLDVGSLETLVAALNSPDDERVIAAMDLLEQKGKAGLVPALILYHPSPDVLVPALDLFARTRRTDFLPLVARLAAHEFPEVRAAALRASSAVRPDPEVLRRAIEHHCPVVNVTAMVGLAVGGWTPMREAELYLLNHIEYDSEHVRPMIARAIRYRPNPGFAPVLLRLAEAPEEETRRETVMAMQAVHDERFIPALLRLLPERALREEVRDALVALGAPALGAAEERLADPATPLSLRVHLPRTIARFQNERAARILVRHLLVEPRGMVRYKALRGLGRMVSKDPSLRLDEKALDEVIGRTVGAGFRRLHWRVTLEHGAEERPARRTTGHELLVQLLLDKERLLIERLFRMLGLRYRGENLARIYDGLESGDEKAQSSSRELLEGTLPPRLGEALLALIDDLPAAKRLAAGDSYYAPADLGYEELLAVLADEPSETLRCVAAYHAAEIGVRDLRPSTRPAGEEEIGVLDRLRQRAEEMAEDLPRPARGVAHEG
jgi:AAA family ATP:ADP antiporter